MAGWDPEGRGAVALWEGAELPGGGVGAPSQCEAGDDITRSAPKRRFPIGRGAAALRANEREARRQAALTYELAVEWGFILLWLASAAAIRGAGRRRDTARPPGAAEWERPRPRQRSPAGTHHVLSGVGTGRGRAGWRADGCRDGSGQRGKAPLFRSRVGARRWSSVGVRR